MFDKVSAWLLLEREHQVYGNDNDEWNLMGDTWWRISMFASEL